MGEQILVSTEPALPYSFNSSAVEPRPARTVQVIRNPNDLAAAAEWKYLDDQSQHPMHQHAWLLSCAKTFAPTELIFVVVRDGSSNHPVAVAPLARRTGLVTRLEPIGVNELYEPSDFPHADAAALHLLVDSLSELGHPIVLKRFPADSPVLPALRRAYSGRGLVLLHPVIGHPWIGLDSSWTDADSKLKAKWRSSLHRAERNANRAGPVKYEFLSPTVADWEPLLNEAFRVEAAGWKGRAESALLDDDLRRLFYRRYARLAVRTRILRLCFMRIGGEAVAMQLAVQCGKAFCLLKMGYDERFHRCSPGHLLMRETIRYAAESGADAFEFLGTAEPWTRMWTKRVRPCVSVRVYPNSSKGLLALAADTVQIGLRKIAGVWQI